MSKKEYIERDRVLRSLAVLLQMPFTDLDDAWEVVQKTPAADVVEVRHGEWIIKTNYKTPVSHAYIRKEKLYICPYCGKDYRQHMNFCGHCGAKMDGGKYVTP